MRKALVGVGACALVLLVTGIAHAGDRFPKDPKAQGMYDLARIAGPALPANEWEVKWDGNRIVFDDEPYDWNAGAGMYVNSATGASIDVNLAGSGFVYTPAGGGQPTAGAFTKRP